MCIRDRNWNRQNSRNRQLPNPPKGRLPSMNALLLQSSQDVYKRQGTGGGKTYFILTLIEALLRTNAVLFVLDPKNADLADLQAVMPDVHYKKEMCIRDRSHVSPSSSPIRTIAANAR